MKITASTTLAELAQALVARGLNAEAELSDTGFQVTLRTSGRRNHNAWAATAERLYDAVYLALKQYDTQLAKSARSS